jgi:hypothetical protein
LLDALRSQQDFLSHGMVSSQAHLPDFTLQSLSPLQVGRYVGTYVLDVLNSATRRLLVVWLGRLTCRVLACDIGMTECHFAYTPKNADASLLIIRDVVDGAFERSGNGSSAELSFTSGLLRRLVAAS